uniref:Uncharacterized protein n=1 Tax=Ascaris lumbricoides TaxID=6252 RepID=A0A0M3IS08_ASCLU
MLTAPHLKTTESTRVMCTSKRFSKSFVKNFAL